MDGFDFTAAPAPAEAFELGALATDTVNITKDTTNGGFGMRISVEGVVTGYSVPGGAAEVRDGGNVLRSLALFAASDPH